MTTQPNTDTAQPYAVRTKKVGGKEFTQIYVPSKIKEGVQECAWIELVDPPIGDDDLGLSAEDMLALLYDPTYVADWKVAYLHQAYREFRDIKNARDRGDLSYSEWAVEIHDGPHYVSVSIHEEQVDSEMVVDQWLTHVSAKQAEQIRLYVFDQLSFVEIARDELPDGEPDEIAKRANSIGRSVKRGLNKIGKFIETQCPEMRPASGV